MKNNKAKWKTGACVVCGTTEDLTRDHVVPKWFTEGFKYFGFRERKANMGLGKGHYKYQSMCATCNKRKSGIIDYSNPLVRAYVRQFIDNVREILDIHERG